MESKLPQKDDTSKRLLNKDWSAWITLLQENTISEESAANDLRLFLNLIFLIEDIIEDIQQIHFSHLNRKKKKRPEDEDAFEKLLYLCDEIGLLYDTLTETSSLTNEKITTSARRITLVMDLITDSPPKEVMALINLLLQIVNIIRKQIVWNVTSKDDIMSSMITTITEWTLANLTSIVEAIYKNIYWMSAKRKVKKVATSPAKRLYFADLTEDQLKVKKEATTLAKRLYISDLTEEELMTLFCKGPLFRFELRKVAVISDMNFYNQQFTFHGFISAADRSYSGLQAGFSHEYNNYHPVAVPNMGSCPLHLHDDFVCSIPASNSVQIHVQLHITAAKVDDVENDHNEVKKDSVLTDEELAVEMYHRELMRHSEGYEPCEAEKCMYEIFSLKDEAGYKYEDGVATWVSFNEQYERKKAAHRQSFNDRIMRMSGGKNKDAWVKAIYQEKDVENDNEAFEFSVDNIGWVKSLYRDIEEKEKKENDNNNEAFEICNEFVIVDLSYDLAKSPYGGHGGYVLNGKDGSLELFYVALKFPVDAALEVEFVATSEEMLGKDKVVGEIVSYYVEDPACCNPDTRNLYKEMLYRTKPDVFVKPGKINLMRSVVPVPAQCFLAIDVKLCDLTSGDIILQGFCSFGVPLEGSRSSSHVMKGVDNFGGRLNLKVDWKLPFDMASFLGC